jgi:hypothetical protein
MAEASSPSSFDPRLARVVKIKIADQAGEATIGTGYLVAPGLVLTARHVLWRDGKETNGDHPDEALRVRAATGPSAGASLSVSKVIRLGEASGVDVAVLVVPGLEPVAGTAVVGARFTTSQMVPGCWMIGYPNAAHQNGIVGPEYVGVSLLPVSGSAGGRIAVKVDTTRLKRDTGWPGLSGSGVVDAQNRLVGILVDVQVRWHDRLAVIPVQGITTAASEQVHNAPELAPLLELPVVEEIGEDPLFDHSKFPPRMTDLHGESLFDVLQFKYRVVDFITDGDRDHLLQEALSWVRGTGARPGVKVAVVTGRAGVGKSRLAAEICDQLAANDPWWRAGFADHQSLLAAPVPVVPTVIVVDYPERHPEAVGAYLAKLHEVRRTGVLQVPVRVVLVSRDERSWFERARTRCKNLDQLIDHRIALGVLEFNDDARVRHATAAYAAYCDGFDLPEESQPALAVHGKQVLDRPLLAHAAALLAAWRLNQAERGVADAAGEGPEITNQGRLLDDLIGAEVGRLRRLRLDDNGRDAGPVFTNTREVQEALCVTTLTTPAHSDLPELLALTEAFGSRGNTNTVTVADALRDCFGVETAVEGQVQPQVHIAAVEPDLIAAHLLATTPGQSGLIKRLVTSDIVAEHPAYRAQLIGALALASKDYPGIGADLKAHLADSLAGLIDAGDDGQMPLVELLADHLSALVEAAVDAAADQDLTAAHRLATALSLSTPGGEHRIDSAAVDVYQDLPYPNHGLAGLGAALARRALAHSERANIAGAIASASMVLGIWLADNGQRSEALAASQRAVDLYEELAAVDRVGYLLDLAGSVNNLAVRLAKAGRRPEALDASQRAVDLYEELASGNSDAGLPALAKSVHNLAVHLAEAGRHPEALAASQRAVDLHEKLAALNRDAYLPTLAGSINNLASYLAEMGRRPEALSLAQSAVKLREELVAGNRAAYLPALATSVDNLANHLAAAGRRPEALAEAQRAADLYLELADQNRAAHLPSLARGANNLAVHLAEMGRHPEALSLAQSAVKLREELVAGNRAAYLPDLATSVSNLASYLAEAGRRSEALAMAQRAVDLFEELAAGNRAAYLSALATSVNNLANHLAEAGRGPEALSLAQSAVNLREELVAANRAAYLPDLATSVNNLANHLAEAGRRSEALAEAQRAVDLYEELAAGNRAAYLPDLARSCWTAADIRRVLVFEALAGLAWCDRAIALYRELAETEPAAFTDDLTAVQELRAELETMRDAGSGT